ncbi:MAG: serine hydrolase domain-containing protein [Luteolibacter sp.]
MAVCPAAMGRVFEVFERNFRDRGELGASISIWWDGSEVLSEGYGWCERERQRLWTPQTLVPVYSATKVPAAAALLLALASRGLNEQTPVREVWPSFPLPEARFSHLLSHQCGLAALDRRVDVFDHAAVVGAIEAQEPAWSLGDGHGYHPRVFGALVDEPVRRLTGITLGAYWREKIAVPLQLDFWIGLPETEWTRVARLYPGKAGTDDLIDGFYKQLTTSGTYTRRAFSSPHGLHAIHEMNEPRAWAASLPALGGVGTASALAKFYQAAIGAIESPLTPHIRQALATPISAAHDRVLLRPTVFTCGAQMDPLDGNGRKIRQIYGNSKLAFGHPGAGGGHAMGDPATGISFAYTMNQMNLSVMPGLKCQDMIDALFSEIA